MIGRMKTAIVTGSGDDSIGVITEIVANLSKDDSASRISFKGPVQFQESSQKHISSVILPAVDRITDCLGLNRTNFELSVINLGATAAADIGIKISGFSSDLPVMLAMLSAATKISFKQNAVCTGHIASTDGDIVSVKAIPAKLEAANQSTNISEFIIPDPDKDISQRILTPTEYRSIKDCLLSYKGEITIQKVKDINDAIRLLAEDRNIILGALQAGFFNHEILYESESPVIRAANFLSSGNEQRFWKVLGSVLLNGDSQSAKQTLRSYIEYYIKNQQYPEYFGENLLRMVISLPPSVRKREKIFHLIPMELFIKLTQNCKETDHSDIKALYKSVFGEGIASISPQNDQSDFFHIPQVEEQGLLIEHFLSELSPDNLATKQGRLYDDARASYPFGSVTVKDSSEFNEAITSFCAHVFRYTGTITSLSDKADLEAEAIDLVEKTFMRKGGYKAALAESISAINGGLRLVFDATTEYLKKEAKAKYVTRIFREFIDPLEWEEKVKLTEAFMRRIRPELPEDLRDEPVKKLAFHLEPIIMHYVESISKVAELLKRL